MKYNINTIDYIYIYVCVCVYDVGVEREEVDASTFEIDPMSSFVFSYFKHDLNSNE